MRGGPFMLRSVGGVEEADSAASEILGDQTNKQPVDAQGNAPRQCRAQAFAIVPRTFFIAGFNQQASRYRCIGWTQVLLGASYRIRRRR
jgi:hypothetical protein